MSLFTATDRDNIKAAMVQFAIDGFASVSVGGNTVTVKDLDQLRRMLEMVNADLASAQTHFGLKMVELIPPGTG